jgi:HK97 family phage portal protein
MFETLRQWFGPMPEPESAREMANATRQDIARLDKASRPATRAIDSFTEYPGWTEQMLEAFGQNLRHYRVASIEDALGVPAVFRAVSLIANTMGMLAMETYRDGVKLTQGMAPRLVARPTPDRTAHRFYSLTGYYLATRGEVFWWVGKRDGDDLPMSLYAINPREINIDAEKDRLNPVITWNIGGKDKVIDARDMRQIILFPDEDGIRGRGPLQLCGAAVSVAVESNAWAAKFYRKGGYPSIVVKAAGSLGDTDDGQHEAQLIREQFEEKISNGIAVIDEGIEDVDEFNVNPQGAQMLDARLSNRGDVANMFAMPGKLLEYNAPGSSLTYQNVPEVFREWVRTGLQPSYLSPVEQEMSDLLPRSTLSAFNIDAFEKADPKARWETYKIMGEVLGTDEAARIAAESEGFAPGDIEFLPVPPAPPQAFPTTLPVTRAAEPVKCTGRRVLKGKISPCGKLLAITPPYIGKCPRCGTQYVDEATA